MITDVQLGWVELVLSLVLIGTGAESMYLETTQIGMLGGGLLLIISMVTLFYGYIVMGGS